MALRMEARRIGLGMQLAPQEWPHWLARQPPSPCAQYHRPRLGFACRRLGHIGRASLACGSIAGGEVCEDEKLLSHFGTLPADVFKVEADPQMVAVYWAERGEAEILQRINAMLKALA